MVYYLTMPGHPTRTAWDDIFYTSEVNHVTWVSHLLDVEYPTTTIIQFWKIISFIKYYSFYLWKYLLFMSSLTYYHPPLSSFFSYPLHYYIHSSIIHKQLIWATTHLHHSLCHTLDIISFFILQPPFIIYYRII